MAFALGGFFFVEIFTTALSNWRMARHYQINLIDISVQSGYNIFKGSWDLTLGYKSGRISEEEDTAAYKALLNASWKANRAKWLEFIAQTEPLALACYCTAHSAPRLRPDGSFFCHRFVLKDILEKLCHAKGIEFRYYGELS